MPARNDRPLNPHTIARIRAMHDAGRSARDIAAEFNRFRIPTVRGGAWSKTQVLRIVNGRRA